MDAGFLDFHTGELGIPMVYHARPLRSSFSQKECRSIERVSRLIWSHERVKDLGQNPGEGDISDANKNKRG